MLDQPSLVDVAARTLGETHELPWIPAALEPPPAPEWGWGVGASRRVIHLVLDLFRLALRDVTRTSGRGCWARDRVDCLLGELDEIRAEVAGRHSRAA